MTTNATSEAIARPRKIARRSTGWARKSSRRPAASSPAVWPFDERHRGAGEQQGQEHLVEVAPQEAGRGPDILEAEGRDDAGRKLVDRLADPRRALEGRPEGDRHGDEAAQPNRPPEDRPPHRAEGSDHELRVPAAHGLSPYRSRKASSRSGSSTSIETMCWRASTPRRGSIEPERVAVKRWSSIDRVDHARQLR